MEGFVNAPVHKDVQRHFPSLYIKYLLPYAPFLNPIGNRYSVFKAYLNQFLHVTVGQCTPTRAAREGRPLQDLRVETALPHVTQEIVYRNYDHANTYLSKCIQQEDLA